MKVRAWLEQHQDGYGMVGTAPVVSDELCVQRGGNQAATDVGGGATRLPQGIAPGTGGLLAVGAWEVPALSVIC